MNDLQILGSVHPWLNTFAIFVLGIVIIWVAIWKSSSRQQVENLRAEVRRLQDAVDSVIMKGDKRKDLRFVEKPYGAGIDRFSADSLLGPQDDTNSNYRKR